VTVLQRIFGIHKPLIGMCHLLGLPGRPRHNAAGGMDAIAKMVSRDVRALQDAHVDGLVFYNENDIPYGLSVPHEIAAAMAAVVAQIKYDNSLADGAIVGTSLKVDGVTWNPVDVERAHRVVELAHRVRELAG